MGIFNNIFGAERSKEVILDELERILERHSNIISDINKEGVTDSHISLYKDLENYYRRHRNYTIDKTDSGLTVKSFDNAIKELIDKYKGEDHIDEEGEGFRQVYNDIVDIYNRFVERFNQEDLNVEHGVGLVDENEREYNYTNDELGYDDNNDKNYNNYDKDDTIKLHEERLRVDKDIVHTGEVKIDKDVVTERQEFDVPVSHEEVEIKRVKVNEVVDGEVDYNEFEGEEIRIPLTEERINIEKENVVSEELVIKKNKVQGVEHVDETVRKEVADINQHGDLETEEVDNFDRKYDDKL